MLLKYLAGRLSSTSGKVLLDGEKVADPPQKKAVVFLEYGRWLFSSLRVADNVELPLKNAGAPKAKRKKPIAESLAAVSLSRVLFKDELFVAVDAPTHADLEDLSRSVWKKLGVIFLLGTNDIDVLVCAGERVIILSSFPTVVREGLLIDLPTERHQLETHSLAIRPAAPPRVRAEPVLEDGPLQGGSDHQGLRQLYVEKAPPIQMGPESAECAACRGAELAALARLSAFQTSGLGITSTLA